MNKVFETETFSKLYDACDKREKEFIDKVKDQLKKSVNVGKPLRFNWFREKRYKNRRLFYLTNKDKAILVAFGKKKEQQKIIDHILENRDIYLDLLNSL